MAEAADFSIGFLASRTGCKVETIRYYERIGLLPAPARSGGGQRRFGPEHLMRLNFVRRARELGFTLDEVRALLELVDKEYFSCAEVEKVARTHLDAIRAKIADLRRLETVMAEMVAQCSGDTVPDCPVIEALFQGPAGRRVE